VFVISRSYPRGTALTPEEILSIRTASKGGGVREKLREPDAPSITEDVLMTTRPPGGRFPEYVIVPLRALNHRPCAADEGGNTAGVCGGTTGGVGFGTSGGGCVGLATSTGGGSGVTTNSTTTFWGEKLLSVGEIRIVSV
jgi:hypothetical protein